MNLYETKQQKELRKDMVKLTGMQPSELYRQCLINYAADYDTSTNAKRIED